MRELNTGQNTKANNKTIKQRRLEKSIRQASKQDGDRVGRSYLFSVVTSPALLPTTDELSLLRSKMIVAIAPGTTAPPATGWCVSVVLRRRRPRRRQRAASPTMPRRPPESSLPSFPSRFALLVSIIVVSVTAVAASTSNYNMYQYDMTTPQFTPDGRLLQVEYAGAAADRSSPVVLLPFALPPTDTAGDGTISSGTPQDDVRGQDGKDTDQQQQQQQSLPNINNCLAIITTRSSRKVQERLVVLDSGEVDNEDIGSSGSDGGPSGAAVVACLSGVLADSLALLQHVQNESLRRRRWYGRSLFPSSTPDVSTRASSSPMRVAATTIADACQRRAFGGGIRPFGCSIILCGSSGPGAAAAAPSSTTSTTGWSVTVLQTDPSGAVQDLAMSMRSESGSFDKPLVVGGRAIRGGSVRSSIQRRLEKEWSALIAEQQQRRGGRQGTGDFAEGLAKAIEIVLQETVKGNERVRETMRGRNRKGIRGGTPRGSDDDDDDVAVEVAIVSPDAGAYKLTRRQIEKLLRSKLEESTRNS